VSVMIGSVRDAQDAAGRNCDRDELRGNGIMIRRFEIVYAMKMSVRTTRPAGVFEKAMPRSANPSASPA
jgi:hypothetical protein